MQIFRSAAVHLRLGTLGFLSVGALSMSQPGALAAPPKVHVLALGAVRKVPYTPPEAAPAAGKPNDPLLLKVRPLTLDGHQKEWTSR